MPISRLNNRALLQTLMRYRCLEIAVSAIANDVVFFRIYSPEQPTVPIRLTVGLGADFDGGILPPIGPVIVKRSGKVIPYGN